MGRSRWRVSGVTLLVGAVLILLPALAWIQYSWLDQIADADRERRARTLQTAAAQLSQDLDSEVGRALFSLQLDPVAVEGGHWGDFDEKFQTWRGNASAPDIVKAIYFVEGPHTPVASRESEPALRVWNPQIHTFELTPWSEELSAIRTRFVHETLAVVDLQDGPPGSPGPRGRGRVERGSTRQRMVLPPFRTGTDQSVMTPVVRISALPSMGAEVGSRPTPSVKLLGFSIIRFDYQALGRDLLPDLIRKHFFTDGETDYSIAVVTRQEPQQVIYESASGSLSAAQTNPDTALPLLRSGMGQFDFIARAGGRLGGPAGAPAFAPGATAGQPAGTPDPRVETSQVVVNIVEAERRGPGVTLRRGDGGPGEGQWRLLVKHRAGSLEAAVGAARTRNFALSSGILALLAAAIGLIVVSTRRADRLARQQMEFVAAVSHELRTPVSVIGAAAVNLADGVVADPQRVKTYGATIQREARRLGETVERVLQLAGMAAGRVATAQTPLSVVALVEEAITATEHERIAAGVQIELDVDDTLRRPTGFAPTAGRVAGDATALRSAIQNLMSNAIKYGGDARWMRVAVQARPHHATRITVEDRGLGIATEDRAHIFEPFYRGREAVSRQIQGSGLGLHLVQRSVEAHGGTVSVDSQLNRGSVFTIDLPGVHDQPMTARPSSTGIQQNVPDSVT